MKRFAAVVFSVVLLALAMVTPFGMMLKANHPPAVTMADGPGPCPPPPPCCLPLIGQSF